MPQNGDGKPRRRSPSRCSPCRENASIPPLAKGTQLAILLARGEISCTLAVREPCTRNVSFPNGFSIFHRPPPPAASVLSSLLQAFSLLFVPLIDLFSPIFPIISDSICGWFGPMGKCRFRKFFLREIKEVVFYS